MHISLPFALGVAAMVLTSCSTRQPAQSSALTRQDSVAMESVDEKPAQSRGLTRQQLVAMKSEDDKLADRLAAEHDPLDFARWTRDYRSHYYYMGTQDGYDHVAQLWVMIVASTDTRLFRFALAS
jgi:hypothetical protein